MIDFLRGNEGNGAKHTSQRASNMVIGAVEVGGGPVEASEESMGPKPPFVCLNEQAK